MRSGRLGRDRTASTGRVAPSTASSDPGTVRARGCVRSEDHPGAAGRTPSRDRWRAGRPGSGDHDEWVGPRTGPAKEGGTAGAPARRTAGPRPFGPADRPQRRRPKDQTVSEYRPVPPRSTCPPSSTRCSTSGASSETFAQVPGAAADAPALDVLRGPADRERQARHPPRRGPGLQGRLPAVQDHAGLPRRPQGRLGLPRPAGRARRREGARLHRQAATSRRTASPSSTRKCRESVLRHVDAFEEMTERMGYWVDIDRPLPDDGPGLRRVGLVVAQADLRQGPAGRGLPRRAVLPALRHRRCPTTSWRRATRRSPTRRSTSGSR